MPEGNSCPISGLTINGTGSARSVYFSSRAAVYKCALPGPCPAEGPTLIFNDSKAVSIDQLGFHEDAIYYSGTSPGYTVQWGSPRYIKAYTSHTRTIQEQGRHNATSLNIDWQESSHPAFYMPELKWVVGAVTHILSSRCLITFLLSVGLAPGSLRLRCFPMFLFVCVKTSSIAPRRQTSVS